MASSILSDLRRSLVGLGALLLFASASAIAVEISDVARRKAEAHFRVAEAYYGAHAFDQAVAEYLRAYQLAPLPALLFNIARSYRQANDPLNALKYYQRYLEEDPRG